MMSRVEEDGCKVWTEDDLNNAVKRINSGEINFKEAETEYGISGRILHRQKAIENMRAQLNPEKPKKKIGVNQNKKDMSDIRMSVGISCSSVGDVISLLGTATEEVKHLINYECDLIFECKVCRSLFRSLANFISHKRNYCCELYSLIYSRTDEKEVDPIEVEEKLQVKENYKEFVTKPYRITCRKDLTSILKRITSLSASLPNDPFIKLENLDNSLNAFKQTLTTHPSSYETPNMGQGFSCPAIVTETSTISGSSIRNAGKKLTNRDLVTTMKKFSCPICPKHCTTKESVCRHLRNVHQKTDEQLNKLKPRIHAIIIRKKICVKNASTALLTSRMSCVKKKDNIAKELISNALNIGSDSEGSCSTDKDDWKNRCEQCDRFFTTPKLFASHMKGCRNGDSAGIDIETTLSPAFLPFVSLTPINTTSLNKTRIVDDELLNVSNSSSSPTVKKKIGIQVRMNYGKESTVQSAAPAANGPLSAQNHCSAAARSVVVAETASLTRESTQNLVICNGDMKLDAAIEHAAGSSSKNTKRLNDVLSRLRQSQLANKENTDSLIQGSDKLEDASSEKTFDNISVFCADCKNSFDFSDFEWNWEDNRSRNFKCDLRDCDFRSNVKNDLLRHLHECHSALPENELAKIRTVFIAEPRQPPLFDSKLYCCPCSLVGKKDQVPETSASIVMDPIKEKNGKSIEEKIAELNSSIVRDHQIKEKKSCIVEEQVKEKNGSPTKNQVKEKHASIAKGQHIKEKNGSIVEDQLKEKNNSSSLIKNQVKEKHSSIVKGQQIKENNGSMAAAVTAKRKFNCISRTESSPVAKSEDADHKRAVKSSLKSNSAAKQAKTSRQRTILKNRSKSAAAPSPLKSNLQASTNQPSIQQNGSATELVCSTKNKSPEVPTTVASLQPTVKSGGGDSSSSISQGINLGSSNMNDENFKKSVMTILFGKQSPEKKMNIILHSDQDQSASRSTLSRSNSQEEYGGGHTANLLENSTTSSSRSSSLTGDPGDKNKRYTTAKSAKIGSR